jgi:predicted ATPase
VERIGPYELVQRLGVGGMGEVWEAVLVGPAGFRKPVALKCLRRDLLTQSGFLDALLREARLGARLQHPNVVGTLGLSEHDGTWVVALELVQGATVTEVLAATGPFPPRVVLEVGVQACAGLAHAHDAGLVHRDVKPGNLLVDRWGVVKVADLGISVARGEPGAPGVGTPGFAAPEQLSGEAGPRADLFSVGVVLAVCATGQRLFGRGLQGVDDVRRVEERLAAAGFLDDVERAVPGLGDVVRRCLRADPALRWPDARSLAAALEGLRRRQPEGGATLTALLASARPTLPVEPPTPSVGSDDATRLLPVGNLPPPRDAFVGREDLARDLKARVVAGERVLTLLGAGGMGKTRLSLEVAGRASPALPGGGWFVPLGEARSMHEVAAAVARAVGVEPERADPVGQVGRVVASRGRSLWVLDNVETCLEPAAATLSRWLVAAPEATFLCTSRLPLQLAEEVRVAVGPMSIDDAAALFEARAPRPLTDAERPEVHPLCRALDGIPLAVELAAARVRLLGVAGVRQRLSLALLSGGGRDRPERHRSLEASLEGSAELLSERARRAWWRLSVFAGPFPLEAAEAVLDLGATEVLDRLGELVDASLVQFDAERGRFGMLGVVARFAESRLVGVEREEAERRHGSFFAGVADARGAEPAALDDLVAACRRAVARGDGAVAVRTLAGAWEVWRAVGPLQSAPALAEAVLGLQGLAPVGRARALLVAGDARRQLGQLSEANGLLSAALDAFGQVGDPRGGAEVRWLLGHLARHRGDLAAAEVSYGRALGTAVEVGDRRLEGAVRSALGALAAERGRFPEARAAYERSMTIHQELSDADGEASVSVNLGNLCLQEGRRTEAEQLLTRALALFRRAGHARGEGIALTNLATIARQAGRAGEAGASFHRAATLVRAVGDASTEAGIWMNVASLHLDAGRDAEALAANDRAVALRRQLGDHRFEAQALAMRANLLARLGRFDEARATFAEALSRCRADDDRRGECRVLGGLGELESRAGRRPEARAALDAALALARALGDRRLEGQWLAGLARLAGEEGDPATGASLAREAEERLRGSLGPVVLARVLAIRAELSIRLGDRGTGASLLAEAEGLCGGDVSTRAELARVRSVLDAG